MSNQHSDEGEFWDRRYSAEGAIWGDDPSPTAQLALQYLSPQAHVLDVGCGYGRDLAYLGEHGCQVSGVELSREGHRRARERLQQQGTPSELLLWGRFEDCPFAEGQFDAIISHRMVHLMLSSEGIADFARKIRHVLRPQGLLCVGARNTNDLDPAKMTRIDDMVYEYQDRPGHRIRYWDRDAFHRYFGDGFTILNTIQAAEPESRTKPVPCQLTIMVARKNEDV